MCVGVGEKTREGGELEQHSLASLENHIVEIEEEFILHVKNELMSLIEIHFRGRN